MQDLNPKQLERLTSTQSFIQKLVSTKKAVWEDLFSETTDHYFMELPIQLSYKKYTLLYNALTLLGCDIRYTGVNYLTLGHNCKIAVWIVDDVVKITIGISRESGLYKKVRFP